MTPAAGPASVLFVCIHNSARSQMAEAFVNAAHRGVTAYSAGIERGALNPRVVAVMRELGIDIAGNRTKTVTDPEIAGRSYDVVVTVCDEGNAARCPIVPVRGERLHWGFDDPSSFTGSEDEVLARTRAVRDAIRARVDAWLAARDGGAP